MKIILKNIAKIRNAVVELNGITVIAGENNTGKSTVGKALFSVFNSFYNIENQIFDERASTIENALDNFFLVYRRRFASPESTEFARFLVEKYSTVSADFEELKNDLVEFLFHSAYSTKKDGQNVDAKQIDDLFERIVEIINVSNGEILKNVVSKKLNNEFNEQINNIYHEEAGQINLIIQDIPAYVTIIDNDIKEISEAYSLKTEVVYIDDPFILDDVRPRNVGYRYANYLDHKNHLRRKLYSNNHQYSIISEILTNNKLENIYSKINDVCRGEIITTKRNGLGYKRYDSEKVLNIKSISTGLKTFVILKSLLENGALENNGTIVLDEPEIHLHPQWQLLLAELIVLIQKEFNMHILLNTHSPYFMKAIEVFSAKYAIADKCKYYLAQSEGDSSIIFDVTSSPEEIYRLLARPLQDLENMRFQDD